jgi:hypothetical protein
MQVIMNITAYVLGTLLHVWEFDLKQAVVTRIGMGGNTLPCIMCDYRRVWIGE